jgi:hypothetical protein
MLALTLNIPQAKADENLILEMHVDKRVATIGEKINITLTLKNVGNTTVTIEYEPPLFDIFYTTFEGCFYESDGSGFIPVVFNLTLEPGETYSRLLQWNLYQYVNYEYRPPKPGTYYLFGICCPTWTTTTFSTAVTLIEAPVGGYSFSIGNQTRIEPLSLYLVLLTILTATFTSIKRRTKKH